MVIIMDMDSGEYVEDEFGAFQEEVLNAQWLPNQYRAEYGECQLGLQEAVSEHRVPATEDAEAFLRNVYLSQE